MRNLQQKLKGWEKKVNEEGKASELNIKNYNDASELEIQI